MTIESQKEELLISVQDYLTRFESGIKDIVLFLQQGEEKRAFESLVDVVDGLKWLAEALPLVQELLSRPINVQSINQFLLQLNEGLQEGDAILIADILEHEIIPIIEDWNTVIN